MEYAKLEPAVLQDTKDETLDDVKLESPLKLIYVATQTLLSAPILNYACSNVYDFDEITHFAAEVMPQEEYLIYSLDNILCYTICWLIIAFEYPVREDFDGEKLIHKPNCSLIDNCYLSYNKPLCYDSFLEINKQITVKENAHFKEDSTSVIIPSEKVCIDNFYLELSNTCYLETEYFIQEALYGWMHPLYFDYVLPISVQDYKHISIFGHELHSSVLVYETILVEHSDTLEVSSEIIKAISFTHIPEEFESLAGLKCVQMNSYKPALSVLPMSIRVETKADQPMDVEQDGFTNNETSNNITLSETKPCKALLELTPQSFLDSELISLTECYKCGSTRCSCIISDETPLCRYDRHDILVNALEYLSGKDSDISNEGKCAKLSQKFEFPTNVPDWLRFVSPEYLSPKEETMAESFQIAVKPASKADDVEYEITKNYIKDKSVQELLHLAEEVERSFSEKAEHIESLESILQSELNSLEKDLEVVHKIHQTFWDESRTAWVNDDPSDEQDFEVKIYDDDAFLEKDLIDFKKDIPPSISPEPKTDAYAPEVITHLQNRVVQCGCRTRLYCSISGKPDPQIVWLKNGRLLRQSSRYVCSNLVEFGLYIDIFNVKSTDSGEYMCIATNSHGSAETQAYLRVIGHREYSPEEPKFLVSPSDVNVNIGESVTLEWKISGTPVPHVAWFKNAEKVETNLRIDTFSNHRGCCRLVLHDVNNEDSAIYSCYLENEAGSSVSTVLVCVLGNKSSSDEDIFQAGSVLNLSHLSDESNIPSLQYYERLAESSFSPSDTYTKSPGKQKHTKDVPGAPFSPYILNSGKRWVILSWSMPTDYVGRTSSLIYRLERRLVNSDFWKEVGQTRCTIYTAHGLKPGKSYVFRVSAGNAEGWGPPALLSQPVHCGVDQVMNTDQLL